MAEEIVSKILYPRNDLTAGYVRSILDYDPETGIFVWKHRPTHPKSWNTRYAGKVAGRKSKSKYLEIGIDGFLYISHRIAWLHFYGDYPREEIDHIDNNRQNNKICNLREATPQQNKKNL